ncbi:SDR family oxidoreductase [Marinimicrococcus flavescens]|uniref:SDR family oxidoreductase n=1 Tax=Marinimicrococcus flavescens TaxID=3031815 RepID=A0AAP3XPD4_9PROT|nr:SDR family oxidoreductase [Marinimicrococcus flavescens]
MSGSGQLAGKVAVITGGTQGLGEAIARLFAERGATGLVISGRNEERGRRVSDALREIGAEARFVAAELEDVEQVRAVVRRCDEAFGRIDCLVNAAALTDRGNILTTTPDFFDRMFAVNTRAPFFLMQEAVKVMLREGTQGSMVNILSMSAHGGQSFLAPYSASKMALGTLTKNVAFSLLPHRIRVNGLNIGWMDTPGEHAIQKRAHDAPEGWLKQAEAQRPFGRLLKPQEVAAAVAFLCSAESGMMTGSLVDFDQSIDGCWDQPPMPAQPVG